MKLFHLGDLHLGKRVNGYSMLSDQSYILERIIALAKEEKPDGILIAGDVYDKGVPPGDAVGLLDEFLTQIANQGIFVCLIAGNHDSAERLDFASRLLKKNNIHIVGTFQSKPIEVVKNDSFGSVHFYLLPFIKPQSLWPYYPDCKPESYQEAVSLCINQLSLNPSKRNVMIAHQFVTWKGEAQRSDSESVTIGGVGEIDASLFAPFDYTALGHLHQPQKMGGEYVRYAGSPLKYSFSEMHHHKAVTVVELLEKGNVKVGRIPLKPLRDMRQIKGPLESLLRAGKADTEGREDYIRAILTDTEPLIDPLGQLRNIYPNIMVLDFENTQNRQMEQRQNDEKVENLSPEKLFSMFYEKQNGLPLKPNQLKYLNELWQKEDIE